MASSTLSQPLHIRQTFITHSHSLYWHSHTVSTGSLTASNVTFLASTILSQPLYTETFSCLYIVPKKVMRVLVESTSTLITFFGTLMTSTVTHTAFICTLTVLLALLWPLAHCQGLYWLSQRGIMQKSLHHFKVKGFKATQSLQN